MIDWFSGLSLMMQIFWGCAIVGSAIFAVQLVLMLIGIDSDVADLDLDADGGTLDLGGGSAINLFQQNMFAVRAEIELGFRADTSCFNRLTANAGGQTGQSGI